MHERERLRAILARLRGGGFVAVAELASLTGASAATLRRDLAKLAEAGQVRRLHGGVEACEGRAVLATRTFEVSRTMHLEAKRAIAREAVGLCEDGDSIIVNAGTTTFQMVEPLAARRLNVLTNSFPMAQALSERTQNRVMLPGGELYREQGIVLSPFDEDSLQHVSASRMFMSAASVGPLGVVEGDPLIARAEAKLLRRAERLVVLVDSSKFERRGSLVVAPLSRVDTLITDEGAPEEALAMLRSAGVATIVVGLGKERASPHAA